MKFLVTLSLLAVCVAATELHQEQEEQIRNKRGIFAAPIPISYSSQYIHHTPSVAVSYHAPITKYVAPIPAVKVVQPLPVAKVVAPVVSVPYYGYAHSYGHGYGFGHGLGYGFGHFH